MNCALRNKTRCLLLAASFLLSLLFVSCDKTPMNGLHSAMSRTASSISLSSFSWYNGATVCIRSITSRILLIVATPSFSSI